MLFFDLVPPLSSSRQQEQLLKEATEKADQLQGAYCVNDHDLRNLSTCLWRDDSKCDIGNHLGKDISAGIVSSVESAVVDFQKTLASDDDFSNLCPQAKSEIRDGDERISEKSSRIETTTTTVFQKFRFPVSEMDDHTLDDSEGLDERGGVSKMECRHGKRNSLLRGNEYHAREGATSRFSSVPSRPHNGDYGQQQQAAPMKCQPLNSGIADATLADEALNNGGVREARNVSRDLPSNIGALNGASGKRIVTATAPPHLRSCYSQENLRNIIVNNNSSSNDLDSSTFWENAIMNEKFGPDNRLKEAATATSSNFLLNGLESATSSTSGRFAMSTVNFPRAQFDNSGDIEISSISKDDPTFVDQPFKVGLPRPNDDHSSASSNVCPEAISNCQLRPSGQAPMIITGAQYMLDCDGDVPLCKLDRRRFRQGNRRLDSCFVKDLDSSEDAKSRSPRSGTTLEGHLPKSSVASPLELANSPCVLERSCCGVGLDVEKTQYSSNTVSSCFGHGTTSNANDGAYSNSNGDLHSKEASKLDSSCATSGVVHSTQSSRVSAFVNPLPEIRENVAVVSLPPTPTVAESSAYLFPSIVTERRLSWFLVPWSSLKTGVVSRLVKAVSCDSTSTAGIDDGDGNDKRHVLRAPKDIDHLGDLHRVTKLAEYFEKGDVDPVGALKLYHAQMYKRELKKICDENFGSVLAKAQCFDRGLVSLPSRPPWIQLDEIDRQKLFTPNLVDLGDKSKILNEVGKCPYPDLIPVPRVSTGGISFTKTAFPTTSEPNLNAGFTDLPNLALTGNSNDQEVPANREGRRSRRTSYVMATTAQANGTTAMGTFCGGYEERTDVDAVRQYPVSEDASSGGRHGRIDEDVEICNRPENTRVLSSPCAAQSATEQSERILEPAGSGGMAKTELQRSTGMPRQGPPRLSRLQIPEQMERRTSSGSSVSMTPTPTPSPTTGAKPARIQRFINFFSGDSQSLIRYSDGCVAGPGSSTSLSSSYTRASANSSQGICVEQKSRISVNLSTLPAIEGPLAHKQLVSQFGGNRKRATNRNWRDYWVILHGTTLYLCRERPSASFHSEAEMNDDATATYGLSEDTVCINVESCIADIAYDYVKRKFVFRVATQSQTEHLFQASDSQTMIRWIEHLQSCSAHEAELDGISNSMALIIKRYEAQSQSVSPSVKQRRSTGVGGPKSPILSSGQQDRSVGRCERDGAKMASIAASAVNSSRTHSVGVNFGDREKVEKGEQTPGKTRKWRRVRKSGSCPVPAPRNGEASSNPDAMFGSRLEDCPTSGEDDFVPLIVQLCVKVVESQGLDAVGVYRIPGNTAAVNSLIATLDKGFENANFNDSRWRDVNVVSSLLKAYFRKLADPLLTDKLYQQFIDASRIENHAQKLRRIRNLVERLPKVNYETLKYLIFHLKRIVSHSNVNKMEARNLALMFGPSLVRPCGDSSMTTMVTHMSDQCKIVELLITYCDWVFSLSTKTNDVSAPPPAAVSLDSDISNTSFADMSDLLKRVKTTEDELERTKESIVKSILTVRRGSRKTSKGKGASIESSSGTESPATGQAPHFVSWNANGRAAKSSGEFNERNIDEEIHSRQQRNTLPSASTSTKGVCADLRRSEYADHPSPNYVVDSRRFDDNNHQNNRTIYEAAEEMRRRREDHIYAARRIFIAGTEGSNILQQTPPIDTVAKMDLLAQHSRHLNGNPQSLDVLSPETREKIKRMQTDSHLLQTRGQWQMQQLKKVSSERQRIEKAWERAKQDYEEDDFLDNLADNPHGGIASLTASSNPHLTYAIVDAFSLSSDYSTTSSSMVAAFDSSMEKRKRDSLQKQQQKLMSISCTGALPQSECSSNDHSPKACRVDQSALINTNAQYAPVKHSPPASAPPTVSLAEQQRHSVAIPFQSPSSSYGTPTSTSGFSSQSRLEQAAYPNQLYDRRRLKHVTPGTIFNKTADEQRSSYGGSASDNHATNKDSVRRSVFRDSKPWYDELADEDNDLRSVSTNARDSVAASSDNGYHQGNSSSVDQNANNLTTGGRSSESAKNGNFNKHGDAQEKRIRILAPVERGTSRISQKIKFRSKSSSAEKRKDSRRHTLTDMEAIKNVLFGNSSSRERCQSVKEKTPPTTPNNIQKPIASTTGGSSSKQSRRGKLKTWLKESFRRSSPDLFDGGNDLDNGGVLDDRPA